MNRFRHHVFGYTGPTVLAIRDKEQGILGICADTRWDDNIDLFGGKDSRAFQLIPTFAFVDPVVEELGYVVCSLLSRFVFVCVGAQVSDGRNLGVPSHPYASRS